METKTCIICKREKPLSEFSATAKTRRHKNKDGTGVVNRCNVCVSSQRMKRQSSSVAVYLKDHYTKSKSSRKDKFEWSITIDDVLALWEQQEGRCALSGVYMTHHQDRGERKDLNASIDRIRSTEGYVPDNIQLVCQRVNLIKNDLDEASLYWWVKHLYDSFCD